MPDLRQKRAGRLTSMKAIRLTAKHYKISFARPPRYKPSGASQLLIGNAATSESVNLNTGCSALKVKINTWRGGSQLLNGRRALVCIKRHKSHHQLAPVGKGVIICQKKINVS